jgi:hypothetical protein
MRKSYAARSIANVRTDGFQPPEVKAAEKESSFT